MSGFEAASAALNLIASIITLIEGCKQIYDLANDAQKLKRSLNGVVETFPLICDTLICCERVQQQSLNTNEVSDLDDLEESSEAIQATLQLCRSKALRLESFFRNSISTSSTRTWSRYARAAKIVILRRRRKIVKLSSELLESVKLLQANHYFRSVIEQRSDRLDSAICDLLREIKLNTQVTQRPSSVNVLHQKSAMLTQQNFTMVGGTGNIQFNSTNPILGR